MRLSGLYHSASTTILLRTPLVFSDSECAHIFIHLFENARSVSYLYSII
jgi:hypothetical protein